MATATIAASGGAKPAPLKSKRLAESKSLRPAIVLTIAMLIACVLVVTLAAQLATRKGGVLEAMGVSVGGFARSGGEGGAGEGGGSGQGEGSAARKAAGRDINSRNLQRSAVKAWSKKDDNKPAE
ncbi:MAG: hypothetical protein FJX47_05295 [Alphaproteobacteria bacterium]|nr:hypothetical protein [Alphaproteobacteria bacterium]